MPRFSLITPTLQRDSLLQCAASINRQTFQDWEHIVVIDGGPLRSDLLDAVANEQPGHVNRAIIHFPNRCGDGGNTPRRVGWKFATGEWVAYMDDDNYYADDQVLADISAALEPLAQSVKWALFPITRLGGRFYCDPPRSCHVDTLNFVLRREIARWPDTDAYGSDGMLVDRLMEQQVPYAAFPDFRPIAVLPKISFGQP